MKIAVAAEADDTRVAATPDVVKRYVKAGAEVVVERGAGASARVTDEAFQEAGAGIVGSAEQAVEGADVVLVVRRPRPELLAAMKRGAFVIGALDPYGDREGLQAMADAGVAAVAMELMPRITRAQSMDILSSQANLAGYQAVIDAAAAFDRAIPMMMTAAGTVPAAKVFVMGAGVAGLQAIATARRLGGAVSATDVRPAAKEQVASLGAKFVAVENDEFRAAETAGGYAKEMSEDYRRQQAELVASHVAKQDIVITTALIPGRPAPKLVTADMVASMPQGSVIVDLAVERGGNVEGSVAGEVVTVGPATIIGYGNVPGRIAATASLLYAKNLYTFVDTVLLDKETKAFEPDWEDELLTATLLTRDGALVHQNFGDAPPKPAPGATPAPAQPAAAAGKGPSAEASSAQRQTDPKGADPTGADPTGADPTGADPKGADPKGADPKGADPKGADPKGADPTGADPTGADPKGSDPKGSDAKGAGPQSDDPKGSDPKGSDPKGSDPKGSDPKGSDPKGSDPKGSDPKGSDPKGSDPKGSDPKGSNAKDGPSTKPSAPGTAA